MELKLVDVIDNPERYDLNLVDSRKNIFEVKLMKKRNYLKDVYHVCIWMLGRTICFIYYITSLTYKNIKKYLIN